MATIALNATNETLTRSVLTSCPFADIRSGYEDAGG
jgi:hypothetical protein